MLVPPNPKVLMRSLLARLTVLLVPLVFLLLAFAPASAHAQITMPGAPPPPPAVGDITAEESARALEAAENFWGGHQCRGLVRVIVHPGASVPQSTDQNGIGWAVVDGYKQWNCEVHVAAGAFTAPSVYGPDALCQLYAHEIGHLTGWEHSTDPNDTMYPTLVRSNYECASLKRPDPVVPDAIPSPEPTQVIYETGPRGHDEPAGTCKPRKFPKTKRRTRRTMLPWPRMIDSASIPVITITATNIPKEAGIIVATRDGGCLVSTTRKMRLRGVRIGETMLGVRAWARNRKGKIIYSRWIGQPI